jgi:hypothetical protein
MSLHAILSRIMKLPLATGILSAAILVGGCGGATTSTSGTGSSTAGHYVMRVDRTYDKSQQPTGPSDTLPDESYRERAPADRWEIAIEGNRVVLTEIGSPSGIADRRLEGTLAPESTNTERRFELGDGKLGGGNGRLILRGDEAELTIFGSGVPILMSERGKLLTR